jgi:FMN reductase
MSVTILGVCGNPRPASRTLAVVQAAVAAIAREFDGRDAGAIDLIELRTELFSFGSEEMQKAIERVMQADVLVVGTPVYKASYTGVLKAFCDHIAHDQLASKLAVPLMVGGSLQHYLALETHLRPLLVELGATCATPGLYVVETELEQLPEQLETYVQGLKRPFVDALRSGH